MWAADGGVSGGGQSSKMTREPSRSTLWAAPNAEQAILRMLVKVFHRHGSPLEEEQAEERAAGSRGAGNSPSPSMATADGCASRAAESARAAAAALQLPWLQPAVPLRTKSAQQRARSKPVPFPE